MKTSQNLSLRQRKLLIEAARNAESVILQESRVKLLLEAADEADLSQVKKIISKLERLRGITPSLDKAISTSITEMNKHTGGGILKMTLDVFKQSIGAENPIMKSLKMVSTLERGFKQLPTVLKNAGVDIKKTVDQTKTLTEVALESTEKSGGVETLKSNMMRAFTPDGIWGYISGSPYLDTKKFVAELFDVQLKKLVEAFQTLLGGPTTDKVKDDLQAKQEKPESQTGEGEKSSGVSQEAKPVSRLKAIQKISSATKVSPENVKLVIDYLADQGALK